MGKIHDRFKAKAAHKLETSGTLTEVLRRGMTGLEKIEAKEAGPKDVYQAIQATRAACRDKWGEVNPHDFFKTIPEVKKFKGQFSGLCNRSACLSPREVIWYNWGSHAFYCEDCARMLNRENKRFTDADGQPVLCSPKTAEEAKTLHVH